MLGPSPYTNLSIDVMLPARSRAGEIVMPPLPERILADLLTSPNEAEPFLTRVKKVIATYPPGDDLLDQAFPYTIWGTIRWSRSLGWPIAPRMADGFSVWFQHVEVGDPGVGPGRPKTKNELVRCTDPLLWDGPHDDENFRVSFLCHGHWPWRHQAIVELKSAVRWEGSNPWWLPPARRIRYPESLPGDGTFPLNKTGPTYLDEFVVVNSFH
jgi:hypothetical protein